MGALLDEIRLPFLISANVVEAAIKAGPDAVEDLLSPLVQQIEHCWKAGSQVELVVIACASLRSAIGYELPNTEADVRLCIVEADATLAAARSVGDAERAFDLAEMAQVRLFGLSKPSAKHTDLLGEALLVASVALKAIGMFDDSIEYMRLQISDLRMDDIEAVPLLRQQVMMFQDEGGHLRLLEAALAYRQARPLEYYRTIKRVLEFLLSNGRSSAAMDLAPELGRAFTVVASEMSALAHVSFYKNVAQILAVQGQSYRALRLLYICDRLATTAGFAGQLRQIGSLMAALESESQLLLPTFSLSR